MKNQLESLKFYGIMPAQLEGVTEEKSKMPICLSTRYLQTFSTMSAAKNSPIQRRSDLLL